jgi:predicted alpha-1,2-mannosidase
MKNIFRTLLFCYLIVFAFQAQAQKNVDYTKYVNPFIGTSYNGHTFPGACSPFGMVQPSPVTGTFAWQYCSEYVYTDSLIWGFSQTHLNGTGCQDLGDILLMPLTGKRHRAWNGYRSRYFKDSEVASPGYYSVRLVEPQVKVELTATPRVAFHRYTFANPDSASILIDLQHGNVWNEQTYHKHVEACEVSWENPTTLVGHERVSCWVRRDFYFVMKFSRPVVSKFQLPIIDNEKAPRFVASFDIKSGDVLLVKVAMSTSSIEGAKKNLEAELPSWDFDKTCSDTKTAWNNYLSRIVVDGSNDQKTNFYTCFYHALLQPNIVSDVDGMYSNAADSIVKTKGDVAYSTFSLWDTYRAAHPFYTIVIPERVNGFINSMLEQGDAQGFLPIWALWGKENYCMVANHGVPVVVDAYLKGFRGFDVQHAYDLVKRSQTISHYPKSDWETYMKYGYFPADIKKSESVSCTLETTTDDYAASVFASALGKKADAAYFAKRANFYKNLFDKTTCFMRPRLSNGKWLTPFDPDELAGNFTEGNSWQYTWHVQHDVQGLISLMGGKERFVNKLDSLFTIPLSPKYQLSDVTGLIGQYAHGNEPSHHIVYLYTLAGHPKRTQELVRQICDAQYKAKPDGLCGNDDCGQMSAWYMFSAMGFYPVCPVGGKYVFGAPQLNKIVLHLHNGKVFTIIADGLSEANKYVSSITLNGKPYSKNYITHATILNGGTLVYKMTSK